MKMKTHLCKILLLVPFVLLLNVNLTYASVSANYDSLSYDGFLYHYGTDYATVRNAGSSSNLYNTSDDISCGQSIIGRLNIHLY